MTKGHNLVWERVPAVIDGGGWEDTTFILTWDDWGGYADSVPTPSSEIVPDALHPAGFQAISGSRIPLLMFGGKVAQTIDPEWHSHASIPKAIIDLLGLGPLGVPLAGGEVGPSPSRSAIPNTSAYGSTVKLPIGPAQLPVSAQVE